jgi:Flp pilus assembly protein TadD
MGSQKLAQEAYEQAVKLTEGELLINPKDPDAISRLAEFYADVGRGADARTTALKALSLAPKDGNVLRRIGMMYELLGERQQALRLLGQAIEQKDPLTEIKYSPEMKGLREDPGYRKLMSNASNKK